MGDTACTDPDSDRLVWTVYTHRGEQRAVAQAGTQSAAWGEAARLARLADG